MTASIDYGNGRRNLYLLSLGKRRVEQLLCLGKRNLSHSYQSTFPPVTLIACPVISLDSSEQRNRIAFAM